MEEQPSRDHPVLHRILTVPICTPLLHLILAIAHRLSPLSPLFIVSPLCPVPRAPARDGSGEASRSVRSCCEGSQGSAASESDQPALLLRRVDHRAGGVDARRRCAGIVHDEDERELSGRVPEVARTGAGRHHHRAVKEEARRRCACCTDGTATCTVRVSRWHDQSYTLDDGLTCAFCHMCITLLHAWMQLPRAAACRDRPSILLGIARSRWVESKCKWRLYMRRDE